MNTNDSTTPPWVALLDAARDASFTIPASRYVALATVRDDGTPAVRTVVVRGRLDPDACLLITTDGRSAKVEDLAASPRAEVCWYFHETREQFRLAGRVTLVGPGRAEKGDLIDCREKVWAGLPDASKRTFVYPAPGTPLANTDAFRVGVPDAPPHHFVLLILEPDWVEYLDLKPEPHHTRTRFQKNAEGWSSEPLNP